MNRWLKLLPVTALTLTACNAVIIDNYPSEPVGYYQGEFEAVAGKGNVAAIVVGNPFSGNAASFGNAVRDLMQNQVGRGSVSFSTAANAPNTKPYKIVVVFNPGRGLDNNTMCQKEDQTPTGSGGSGQLSVAMMLCFGDSAKTGTSGRVGGVQNQSDPNFSSLVREVARAVIPSREDFGLQRQNAP